MIRYLKRGSSAAALADAPATDAPAVEITPEADAVAALLTTTTETETEARPAAHAEGRKLLETESDDDAVTRLMAATNSAMDDEESRRRHSAISHLKAAVAATKRAVGVSRKSSGFPAMRISMRCLRGMKSMARPWSPSRDCAPD